MTRDLYRGKKAGNFLMTRNLYRGNSRDLISVGGPETSIVGEVYAMLYTHKKKKNKTKEKVYAIYVLLNNSRCICLGSP